MPTIIEKLCHTLLVIIFCSDQIKLSFRYLHRHFLCSKTILTFDELLNGYLYDWCTACCVKFYLGVCDSVRDC